MALFLYRSSKSKSPMNLSESFRFHKRASRLHNGPRFPFPMAAKACSIALALVLGAFCSASASNHYTTKQLDALAARVGKIFWLGGPEGGVPEFLTTPAANSTRFRPASDDSFVISDLTGRAQREPYYVVRFGSGKVGYISPQAFHEALNLTILTADPRAQEKQEQEKQSAEEKERIAWIQAQPWPADVKDSAIRKQPVPGLNTGEVKRILGPPTRITRLRTPTKVGEEHWFYKDGSVLVFHNRLLTKVDKVEKK